MSGKVEKDFCTISDISQFSVFVLGSEDSYLFNLFSGFPRCDGKAQNMGKKGSWFSAIKRVFIPNSKEKLVNVSR